MHRFQPLIIVMNSHLLPSKVTIPSFKSFSQSSNPLDILHKELELLRNKVDDLHKSHNGRGNQLKTVRISRNSLSFLHFSLI